MHPSRPLEDDRDELRLLHALSKIAARVQRARTLGAVLETAADGLSTFGFTVVLGRVEGDRLAVVRTAVAPVLEQPTNRSAPELVDSDSVALADLPEVSKPLANGDAICLGDADAVLRKLLPRRELQPSSERVESPHGIGNLVVAPLVTQDRPWGVLLVAADALSPRHAAALALFAAQLSSAIEASESIEALEQRNRELEAMRAMVEASHDDDASRRIPRLLQILCDATSSDTAGLYRADSIQGALVLEGYVGAVPSWFAEKYRTVPWNTTINGLVANGKRPLRVSTKDLPPRSREDVTQLGIAETIVLPLIVEDQVVGTINVSRRRRSAYSDEELNSLSTLCGQLTLQLERARLRQEALRRVEDLSLINEVGGLITQQLDLERVFDTAMRHVCRVVDVQQAFLLLLDEHTRSLDFAASSADLRPERIRIALDETSVAELAFRTQQTVAIADTNNDPRTSKQLLARFGHRRLLATPLVSQGESIGVLVLGGSPARPFAEGELNRAIAFANQLASAIHNARLFADLRKSYEELRRTQEALVRRERLAALGELAAVVAHEVRNPLGVIFNSLASLRRVPLNGDSLVLIRIMSEESERLNRMVGDLLEFARPHEPEMAPACIKDLVRDTLESAMRAMEDPGIEARVQIPDDLPLVRIDVQLMRRALLNLVLNSVQAMPHGGSLFIRAQLESQEGDAAVRLEIRDEGPGIPADVVGHIFQPFFTTKPSGTGLGLAVVKSILDAHHARISVQSQERGATFSLTLPVESRRP